MQVGYAMARQTRANALGDEVTAVPADDTLVNSFSAKKMFEDLSRGPPRVITGAVKESDDIGVILVSSGLDCKKWTKIAETTVERYEYVGRVACGDHDHPVVKLYLRSPSTPIEQAFLLAESVNLARQKFTSDSTGTSSLNLQPTLASSWAAAVASPYYPPRGPCVYDIYGNAYYPDGRTPCP